MKNFSEIEQKIIFEEDALAEKRELLKEEEYCLILKKVELRRASIRNQFDSFISEKSKDTQESVNLNLELLNSAVTSYYQDIHRYKDFSGSKWVNAQKQAAYTIKWLVRFRPIQIIDATKPISVEIFDLNLKFALVCGFAFLSDEVKSLLLKNKKRIDSQNKTKNEEEKEYSFYDKLMYDLRYRQLSGKKLTLIFEALELAANNNIK